MLNKYARQTIIAITKYILPVTMLLLLAPRLVQFSPQLTQANQFFHLHQVVFLFLHCLFYLTLYWVWPRIIHGLVNRSHDITQEQLNSALNAKWYLLAALIFFEILVWWR